MIYENVIDIFTILFIVVGILRLVSQGLFASVKLDYSFIKCAIPGYSSYHLSDSLNTKKFYLFGTALRIGGVMLMAAVLVWQYYMSMVQLTHMYGLLFQTYTPKDYSVLWSILSYTGVLLIVAGCVVRWVQAKRMMPYFSNPGWMNVLFAIEPTLYYVAMTFSKKVLYIMNKNPKYMSSEEYQIYCALLEE